MKKETTSNLPLIGFGLTMVAFGYLMVKLLMGDVPLNFATWSLWVVIDILLLISMIDGGNKRPWIMVGFTAGASVIAFVALGKAVIGIDRIEWGKTETFIVLVVALTLVTWSFTPAKLKIIVITLAMYVAMIPSLVDCWNQPVGQDPLFWGASSIACVLTVIGSKKDIAGIFMPVCGTIGNGLMCAFALRQFFV